MGADSSSNQQQRGTVLVVDDEPALVSLFAAALEERHSVITATSGAEALEQLTSEVDVVLLDRIMPGLSGDAVLDEIRAKGFDCRVAMVTAVEPDIGLIDVDFDEYLVKPVHPDDVVGLVDQLLLRGQYRDRIDEFLSVATKRATLEASVPEEDLESDERYRALCSEYEDLQRETDVLLTDLDDSLSSGALYSDVLDDAPHE